MLRSLYSVDVYCFMKLCGYGLTGGSWVMHNERWINDCAGHGSLPVTHCLFCGSPTKDIWWSLSLCKIWLESVQ